mgnify:CR=1 FL=1
MRNDLLNFDEDSLTEEQRRAVHRFLAFKLILIEYVPRDVLKEAFDQALANHEFNEDNYPTKSDMEFLNALSDGCDTGQASA